MSIRHRLGKLEMRLRQVRLTPTALYVRWWTMDFFLCLRGVREAFIRPRCGRN